STISSTTPRRLIHRRSTEGFSDLGAGEGAGAGAGEGVEATSLILRLLVVEWAVAWRRREWLYPKRPGVPCSARGGHSPRERFSSSPASHTPERARRARRLRDKRDFPPAGALQAARDSANPWRLHRGKRRDAPLRPHTPSAPPPARAEAFPA